MSDKPSTDTPNMPDITPGPIVGLVAAVIAVAAAFGLEITEEQSIAVIGLGAAVAVAFPGFEAWLRRGRLKYLGDKAKADAIAQTPTIINNSEKS